jgi:HK97 family phage major capsid protein
MLARYTNEIEERQSFIDGLVQAAQDKGEDLDEGQLELVTRARDRIADVNTRMGPLEEARRISGDSAERIAQLAKYMENEDKKPPGEVQYRSAGGYVLDRWRSGLGQEEATQRLDLFHRAAAHQTTGDNPGLIPQAILGPIVAFVDAARPFVSALGPRQMPGGSWARPKITQHTSVAAQGAEKTELVSQKMTISKLTATPTTYGGYVNISRQDIDFTQPQIMDIVINDLAAQYAILTEDVAIDAATSAATAGPTLPTGVPTTAQVTAAIWTAAGSVYAAAKGAGRVFIVAGPDMLGVLGPLFNPVNPQNAQSPGFEASNFGLGSAGTISGIPVYISAGMLANNMLVMSSAAFEVYEDRIGSLQVVEPSVLGVQVAYAGYFATLSIEATAIIKIVKTP